MTEIEKAQAYFTDRGIFAFIDDNSSLYIEVPNHSNLNVMVSTSEVIFRAELYDEKNNQG